MTDYALVLTREYPGREWSLNGNDPATLVFHDDGPVISADELDALWPSVRVGVAWDAVRAERDRRLSECDWTQVADAPLNATAKAAWAAYRQALRDVPQTFASPDDVVWPTAP